MRHSCSMAEFEIVDFGPLVEVIPGVKVPRFANVAAENYRGFNLRASIVLDDTPKLLVDSLAVDRRDDGPQITSDSLRTIAVQWLINCYVEMAIWLSFPNDKDDVVAKGLLTKAEASRLHAQGPTKETIEWVARVYKLAVLCGGAPTKWVEQSFSVSRSTAGNWIGRARAAGLIAPTDGES